jgi:hypothetical protein
MKIIIAKTIPAGKRLFGIGRFVARITLDRLEKSFHDAQMGMEVRVERRAVAVKEAHRTERRRGRGGGTGFPQCRLEGPEQIWLPWFQDKSRLA